MIISCTPMRITFFGGGTDYPQYFRYHGGATLGAAINKHTYITVHPRSKLSPEHIRIGYSKQELVNDPNDIQHPAVRECLRFLGINEPIEINTIGELPARTGLGTSSAFSVGLLHALHAYRQQMVAPEQLAREAIYVERVMIGERVGSQDQYTCAYGGLLHLEYYDDDGVSVCPVVLRRERLQELEACLLLVYTNSQRHAHEVLGEQIERTCSGSNNAQLAAMRELVHQGLDVLCSDADLRAFGELLHTSWRLKKQLSTAVSNARIDMTYDIARRAGAIGGKLLGAGGGGFLLLFVEPHRRKAVCHALSDLPVVEVSVARQGTRIVYYSPTQG